MDVGIEEAVGVTEIGVFDRQQKLQLELLKVRFIDELAEIPDSKTIPLLITKLFKHVFT
jgi:hypothetical protein